MKRVIYIIIAVIICLFVGYTANYFQSDSLSTWYPTLVKSSLSPPNYVFPIVWTILYMCMGVSIGLIWNRAKTRKHKLDLIFALQLLLNFTWSITFFYMQNPLWGLINIILLDITVLIYTCYSYRINRLSSWLFVPYIIWLAFATYLNLFIIMYN